MECRQSLVHAYVTSRLDYCHSILYGLPKQQLSKLQRIQNMAARLIMDTMKFDHIKPVLYNLHWLPVNYCIQFKILMITLKAIHGMAPSYLSNLICIRSSSRYSLRNNDTIFLERPKGVMRTTLGARSFHASAPALWNSLPAHIRTIDSLALFKKSLKTYLFKQAFQIRITILSVFCSLFIYFLFIHSFIMYSFTIIILFQYCYCNYLL